MTLFYFVRHAVTHHTGERLSGWMKGIHLTDEGRAQAESVAGRLAHVKLHAVYSSPIDRTMETAEAIAAPHGLPVHSHDGIGEVDYGAWANRTFKTLRRTRLWERVQRFPSGARFPEGETFLEVQARALHAVNEIAARHPRHIVCCVSHADTIKLIAAHFLGVHIDLFQRMHVSPCSATVIALSDDAPMVMALNAWVPELAAEQRR